MNALTEFEWPITLGFEWEWVWPMWRAIWPGCSGYRFRPVQSPPSTVSPESEDRIDTVGRGSSSRKVR